MSCLRSHFWNTLAVCYNTNVNIITSFNLDSIIGSGWNKKHFVSSIIMESPHVTSILGAYLGAFVGDFLFRMPTNNCSTIITKRYPFRPFIKKLFTSIFRYTRHEPPLTASRSRTHSCTSWYRPTNVGSVTCNSLSPREQSPPHQHLSNIIKVLPATWLVSDSPSHPSLYY